MKSETAIQKVQICLDRVTRKWWFYLLFLLLFILRPYASLAYAPEDSLDVVSQALMDPLIFRIPILMPIAKAVPMLLFLSLLVLGNKAGRVFDGYVALLYGVVACFQNTALTESYGLVIVTGNVLLIGVVALLWVWEVFSGRNNFEHREVPWWKWWVAPFAILAFLSPIDSSALSPDFDPFRMLTNEAGLTYCMMTPLILSVLTLYHPTINSALLRVSAFVGILFGVVNIFVWFFIDRFGWWMGVLHLPLFAIAIYAFVLAHQSREPSSG